MMSGTKLVGVFFLLVSILLTTSCSENEEPSPFTAIGEVYTIKKMVDSEVRFGIHFYSYSNKQLSSATVTLPGGETRSLEESYQAGRTLGIEPDSADYTTTYPEEGTYDFDVVAENGETLQVSDILAADSIGLTTFSKVEYLDYVFGYNLEWGEADGAEAYLVRLIDDEGNIIFQGSLLNDSVDSYQLIYTGNGYWHGTPNENDAYKIQLLAYIFDGDAGETDYAYNIQQVSLTEQDVLWGE